MRENLQHGADFDAILAGISGDAQAKKLTIQLIFRYFSKFADKRDQALDALFALCEDPDINVSGCCPENNILFADSQSGDQRSNEFMQRRRHARGEDHRHSRAVAADCRRARTADGAQFAHETTQSTKAHQR
jgi:hypothetical protein